MDLNDVRSLLTLACFLAFMWLIVWAFSRRNRAMFDEAAALPFADEPSPQRQTSIGGSHE
jgi:cytochrome c oxidase cbb3-type subunit 4